MSGTAEQTKTFYHEGLIRPLREGNLTIRLYGLNLKKEFSQHARIFFGIIPTGLGGEELTISERVERTKLIFMHWLRYTLGDEPFGNYPKLHLGEKGDGTIENPFTVAFDATVKEALPGLLAIASSQENPEDIYFTDRSTYEDWCSLFVIKPDLTIESPNLSENHYMLQIVRRMTEEIVVGMSS